jgi:ABC-type molybdate transport system substrate-binding protein
MLRLQALRVGTVAWLAIAAVWAQADNEPVVVPPDHDTDLRVFERGGDIVYGAPALQMMEGGDLLVVWVAGNQFLAMEDVAHEFQKQRPDAAVGVVTLPPGLLLSAIRSGGLSYQGHTFHRLPDVYGSVSTTHLNQTERIRSYVSYAHNCLELMVAVGNPKGVRDLYDLARPDLKVALPNALTEGIMQIYARPILVKLGLWNGLSAGQDCIDCDPVPRVHFTRVHHREIPERIRSGVTDVGLVWRTEGITARAEGGVDAVALPNGQSAIEQATYVAGPLEGAPQREAADAFITFLISPAGQAAYGSFGFLPVAPDERRIRALESR